MGRDIAPQMQVWPKNNQAKMADERVAYGLQRHQLPDTICHRAKNRRKAPSPIFDPSLTSTSWSRQVLQYSEVKLSPFIPTRATNITPRQPNLYPS